MIERHEKRDATQAPPAPGQADPKEIYQANLDAVDLVLWQERWDELSLHLATPAVFRMADYEVRLASDADFVAMSRTLRTSLLRLGANAYHRICRAADWADDRRTRIVGSHRTFILQHGRPLVPPYVSTMPLVFEGGRWRAVGIETEVSNRQVPFVAAGLDATPVWRAKK
ncbi:hypothetical protein [Mesobacterium pallidum]|uniref:hypothetical protein n=1 Tax=Mesobacterium pallidum TaxID=2872037 RepID=UPI001EE188D3|nr:hypothetical protein [Mesobacterium pallidum]